MPDFINQIEPWIDEEEKEQFMSTLEDVSNDLQKKRDEIVDMSEVRKKYGSS